MKVTKKAMRPASDKEECFYCKVNVGGDHKDDCVLIQKMVKVRTTIEYEVSVPACSGKGNVEYIFNDGTWCANNIVVDLKRHIKAKGDNNCLCNFTNIEYIEDTSDSFLDE